MIESPLIRIVVIAMFVFIVISLATAFVHLIRDRGQSDKAVKALSVRIALSIGLFALLMLLYAAGIIGPGH